jgi:hypothetical protein
MKFGNEFWLILFREYISPKLFAVCKPFWLKDLENKGLFFLQTHLILLDAQRVQHFIHMFDLSVNKDILCTCSAQLTLIRAARKRKKLPNVLGSKVKCP